MPLKDVISDANEKWMKDEIERLLKEVREIEKKPNATETEKEVANKKFFTLNNLRSALVSLQSILNLEKNKDKVLVKASVTDDATKSNCEAQSMEHYTDQLFMMVMKLQMQIN
nr:hypothetical protein [Mycoplasmopsis bovis]